MANLLENYSKRLALADKAYGRMHEGERMSTQKKLITAKVIDNTCKFINEAFENSVGTQRSDMGMFKKFALNLTTVAIPNLIANDLVIVHPMSSMSGYITYLEYTAGTNKGETQQGKLLNSVFKLGDVDVNYTAARVVEEFTGTSGTAAWFPVFNYTGTNEMLLKENARIVAITTNAGVAVDVAADASVTVGGDGKTLTFSNGAGTAIQPTDKVKVAYVYDNQHIPQNDLPIVNVEVKNIPLIAKARRIAVYYSQMAAYQAKTDYGFDLGDQLAQKAVGELAYEIDTEVCQLLIDNAATDSDLTFSKTLPIGVSKAEHYEGFMEICSLAGQKIYDVTKKFAPNYMLVSSGTLNVLRFLRGWRAAPAGVMNGPYYAGTLDNLRVYVTPTLAPTAAEKAAGIEAKFVFGVNGDDMMSSAAVYAPYMAIVPTQLLGYADGGMSQGWSTLYDLKILNKDLLVKGVITA